MAPDNSSPASSHFLPFLGGKPRRGSLASINSRAGIDKDVRAQALDEIHSTASRADGLTSFHDFDGESGRAGAKELVSNGVSGLYNRLRLTVGGGTPVKHARTASKGSTSGQSIDADSLKSPSPVPIRPGAALTIKRPTGESSSSLSVPVSPAIRGRVNNGEHSEGRSSSPKIHSFDGQVPPFESGGSQERPTEELTAEKSLKHPVDAVTREDVEKARSAWRDNDRSETATEALARVLSHHEVPVDDQPKAGRVAKDLDSAIDDSDSADELQAPRPDPSGTLGSEPAHKLQKVSTNDRTSQDPQRPPMVKIGPSHLPNFEPSRASSTTDGGDAQSTHSSQFINKQGALEPSPNLNSALQRRRTTLKPPPRPAKVQSVSAHLKSRVLSKEFWMKDDNAKVCFSCGQGFSAFRRKHHCRTCGQIFDAKCTSLVAGRPFGQAGTIRLCNPCEGMIFGSDDDSTVFSDDGGDDYTRSPITHAITEGTDDVTSHFDGAAFSRTDAEVTTPYIGIPVSRRNREAKRRSAVLEFDSHPALARPASSHSLASLSRRPRSSSHRRRQSRHQLARGYRPSLDERGPFYQDWVGDPDKNQKLPTFHNDNIIDPDLAAFLSDDGSDDDENPSIMGTVADANAASLGDREKLGFSSLLGMRKGRSRFGERSGAPSTSRGIKEDHVLSHRPKSSRTRNLSNASVHFNRPSPRHAKSNILLTTMEAGTTDSSPTAPIIEPSHAKVVCSTALHALHDRGRDDVELYPASFDHVKKLLGQLLRDAGISSPAIWQRALMPILMQCTDDVEPDVQAGDDMDIRHYIKLKKVPGGRPGDTSYVSGVVFSKNVALKSMARSISNPRIVIVTFAIEYARHEAHFMSLEPVIAQEQEYLENLVGRIAALRPQVLLVQKNISGLAIHMLEKAGITVAYNIKESVLAAVARVTQTVMIKSIDKLGIDPSHLGQCESFEVKTYVSDGVRKNYIYLSGCDPDLGCTIVLRGGDTKTLRCIKRIAEFMCYVAYNLKLENYLMRDEFVSIPRTAEAQIGAHDDLDPSNEQAFAPSLPSNGKKFKYEQLEKEIRQRVLSASPFVHFMQPYLLTQLRDLERKLATFSMLRDQYAAADEDGDNEDDDQAIHRHFELVRPDMVNVPASKDQPKAVREYLHAVHDAQLEKVTFTFQNHERQWETFVSGEVNPFDPFSHQQIVVLFSVVSSITSAPCSGPDLLGMGFYTSWTRADADNDEDMTLGQYVEDLCLSANSACKSCSKKMCDHFRQYVHGYGQLTASIQRQPAKMRGYANTILMWSTCRVCRQETTVTPMSDHTWKYSFAKYLELSFWSSPLHPRAGLCKHDIHKQFLRCFGFQDMVVRFQYDAIDIYDVVVPRGRVTWKVEADLEVKNDQYLQLETRLRAFTDSIKKRLDSINVDTLDEKKGAEALDYLHELRKRADDDHDELMQKLRQKYARSRYYELLPLNRALRFMDEKALAWDESFNDFEQNYFPSETDIRKLASIQLKNMFEQSQPAPSSVASGDSDTEDGGDTTPTKGSVRRRRTHDEILSEKADDVLLSIVEEHKASTDDGKSLRAVTSNDSEMTLTNDRLTGQTPRKDAEHVSEREDVKHLDLAVPSRSPDASINGSPVHGDMSPFSKSADETCHDEPFAVQPKPLSSGLLERIEQIRSTRAQGGEPEVPESKIPRPVDRKKLEPTPMPPPLFRAQSQPGHVPRLNEPELTLDAVAVGRDVAEKAPADKGLRERLGGAAGRLAGKVGKATPSLIPRSTPAKTEDTHNIVSSLAKHFEQLSREFEKERLKERRQRAMKSRQARANPLASSRPEVEVYRNATDAVGEKTLEQSAREKDTQKDKQARRVMEEHVTESQPEDTSIVAEPATMGSSLVQEPVTEQNAEAIEATQPDTEVEEIEPASDMPGIAPTASRSRGTSASTSDPNSSFTSPAQSGHDLTELGPDLTIPEHRKNVWFKYLAEFWSKRSASGWANLEYPLRNDEHVFADSDIIVREDEPSSVIALSLACADYRKKAEKFRDHPNRAPLAKQGHSHTPSQASAGYPPPSKEDEHRSDIEASLLSDTGTHMKYSFTHNSVRASCKIFYAESFDALRRRCNVADRFIESMSRCIKFDSKGGKTKSLFLRTLDNRFIIKSLQEVELKAFTKFAPDYFNFMSYTLFHGVPSVIAKMFGLFQVNIRNPNTGVDFSYYLLVMENLFYERNPNRRFDLKGSMRNRKIESTGQADEVLLDENLVETIFQSPLFVREASRKLLQASIFNDTLWLCKQNVMDYSLMAGFDDTTKELVVGIIDCIRTYTWDKKLESWIKDRGKNKPTITSPKDYRNRFRVSMMAYVLQAPNCWHQFQAQMPGPRTLKEKDDVKNETEDTEAEIL
ncbi:unnamed protein product [Zymoseptoria tritici ST99CH_1A5]|nr:unnamed protein product [Zymoseptoria tritici ST99CH_1A5]